MIGLLISASLAFSGPSGKTAPAACVAICNHWSYTGIGWQLGLESDVLSLEDAMNLYDRAGVKTCIDMDTRTYEKLAIHYPEIVQRLARYLKAGDLELTGGTYGQPMGTMFSGESDIRQLEYGVKDIEHLFGYRPSTFLNEEEFTFPQLPQILKSAGYKYASLGQLDTWGKAGCPDMEVDAFNWRGPDGTVIPSTPENSLFQGGLDPNYVLKNWGATSASASFQKLKSQGEPLYLGWEEFGWERPETPAWATDASAYKSLTTQAPVKYVTLTDYMNAYGAHPKDTVQLKMDDWTKSLTWGLGGDQLRIYNNKVEANLDAAERFDAVASTMGLPTRAATLEAAVKDQLASQSHDAGLCEYSRWQGDRMAPLNRLEDLHNFTWGALGYNLLDSANNTAQSVLGTSLRFLAAKTNSSALRGSAKTCTVYNPSFWSRSDVVETGRLYPLPANTRGAVVRNSAGKVVPSQIVSAERNPDGSLLVADVAFLAKDVPSLGYDTYGVSFASHETAVPSDLRADKSTLVIENARVRIKLNPETGAISSLVDKRTGREMLRAEGGDYPVFRGQPDPGYPLRGNIPAGYDSSKAKAEITWIDDGPVRCTVKARFGFTHLVFETYVTLSAGKPYAEVTSRILSSVPPRRDDNPKEIQRGYYLSFAPAFKPEAVVRDYPLAIERTTKPTFHALSFVDLAGQDSGLLVLHPGTQYFRFEPDGSLSNLVMREWESYYSGEWGWPRYTEYRHALEPHGPHFSDADRLREATDFNQKLIVLMGTPHRGGLPISKSFVQVSPAGVQLSEFRRRASGGLELRAVEVDGSHEQGRVSFALPVRSGKETTILGSAIGPATVHGGGLSFGIGPWKFETFSLR